MQRLTVDHRTTYRYRRPVEFGEHRLMFRPRDSHDLRLQDAKLTISPMATVRWLHDVFNNSVAIAEFSKPADLLDLHSIIVVDRYPFAEPEFPIEDFAQSIPFSYPASEVPDLGRTIERHYSDPERKITEWARRFLNQVGGATDTEAFLLNVTTAVRDEFGYVERTEPGVQTPVETLDSGSGTCRDYALFMMEAVRSVGLAARYVSGYLYDPAIDGGKSDVSGAGATHAWVQVYLPGAGWVEFDPTNGSYGGRNLVPIAVAREPEQAMPVSGSFDGVTDDFLEMAVSVTVRAESTLEGAA
ncbi:MAG: transglutaminase family protein [Alphaproteobacteria bacterium]|nr:transglutaminase family protein [Alphaproteobacteria bacterium]MDP6565417.1 transglutaminase family protein [Alphaproteobacteria bacterium]